MARVHAVGDRLILCASSHVFIVWLSSSTLSIVGKCDVKEVSDSIPTPQVEKSAEEKQEIVSKNVEDAEIQILASAVSSSGSLLAIATSAKTVLIFDLPTLSLRRGFRIPKAPTSMTFDVDMTHVLVGDRAGHVCRYTVAAPNKCGYVDINGEASQFEGEALSGAISMVLDVAISSDGRYLLVADRDEKIRVSRYPEAYVIQSFCLGHSAYVSSVVPSGNGLFSGGGDGIVHEWHMESGTSIAQSEKVNEEPIRRMCVSTNDSKFCLAAIMGKTLVIFDEKLKVTNTFDVSDALMDITSFKGTIVGVSRSCVIVFNPFDGTSHSMEVPSELLQCLSESKDPMLNYFKNVTHQNMLDYYKRKAEKLESTKENQIRKRKARQLREEAAKVKKVASEAEMETAS
ncbi:tRNA (guanine-N(7)-)-methyltransferase non-catalytic subunit [Trichostrongylus colubriformis]|uniref:tRNA (guanine-N(7)-)-methyltransferase non-catalytic subunit n=1 Tax=Trichostrongylus colubriformis TaxID=6319 RepID=A0AAN8IHZ1_TRICO